MRFSSRNAVRVRAVGASPSLLLPPRCVPPMRPDDESFTGLDTAHRGSRPRGGGRGIYHLNVRNGSRSKGHCARAAAAYIQRAAEYSRDAEAVAELVYTESGHMPGWAEAEPTTYWDAADLWERRNGQLFKRVEFALPLALTPDERQELAVGFAHYLTDAEHLPYTLAIHAGGDENPHCHLMISERGNDGVERDAEQWFKRYNAEHPELGGARKSRALQPKSWLLETRAAWAEQTNHALERAGHEIRIDDRSLAAQGIERLPTLHRGPQVQEMEAREIETDQGKEARAVARANVELAEMEAEQAKLAARLAALERRKAAETAAALNSQQEAAEYERPRREPDERGARHGVGGAAGGHGAGAPAGAGGAAGVAKGMGAGERGVEPDADLVRAPGGGPEPPALGLPRGDAGAGRGDDGPNAAAGTPARAGVVEGGAGQRRGESDREPGGGDALSGVRAAGAGARAPGGAERELAEALGGGDRGATGRDSEAGPVEPGKGGALAVLAARVAARREARQQEEQAQRERERQEEREREQARERERGEDFDLEP
jgi:hypothetical protein